MKQLVYIGIGCFLLLMACRKEYRPIYSTDLSVELKRDNFEDSVYFIKKFSLTSTNDSVLSYGFARIEDENGTIFFDEPWRNIAHQYLKLTERREYDLNLSIYRMINDQEIIDHNESIRVDNIDYPDFIKINRVEVNNNILENDDIYSSSPIHSTLVQIFNSVDYLVDYDEYDVENNVYFLSKQYPPKALSIEFNNVKLPVRSYDNLQWRFYDFRVYYPLVITGGTQFAGERFTVHNIDIEYLLGVGATAGVEFSLQSSDSSQGGIYSGTLYYEWIYE